MTRPTRRVSVAALTIGAAVLPFLLGWAPGLRIAVGGLALLAYLGLARSPKRRAERQVEPPNSHFNPPTVQHRDHDTPWDTIDLAALHEVNREVVARLLEQARVLGPDSLSPTERDLLQRMADATRPIAA
ncbi:MAG: hypothetical protein AB7L66_21710 [Gemmatimonadales bacterium]